MFRFRLLSILISPVALTGCREAAAPVVTTRKVEPVNVTVTPVAGASWDRVVSIVGTLYPKDEATVASEVEGMVQKTLVDFGDRVTDGQQIALLDAATYNADLQREQGATARAQANPPRSRVWPRRCARGGRMWW